MTRPSLRAIIIAFSALALLAFGYWLAGPDRRGLISPLVKSKSGEMAKNSVSPSLDTSIKSPQRRSSRNLTPEQIEWTAKARPTERTSLLLLDLSKIPTEKDLRMAGQLGEELIPTAPANPADIADAAKRAKQEQDNLTFGNAIQNWNLHAYDKAYQMFVDHLAGFPDSPWAAESELHLGCYCQYQGRFDESQKWFESAKLRSPIGHSMNAKITLRLGALSMDQGNLQKASEHFTALKTAADSPSHSTYASYWIMRLSMMKQKETAMRDCAQKSLAEVCAILGKPEAAEKLRQVETQNPDGFNLQEVEDLASQHGLRAQTMMTTPEHLADLPLPWIAHYDNEAHFVAVLAQPKDGKIRLYDTRVGHVSEADYTYFQRQWSGYAVVFDECPTKPGILLASTEGKRTAVGGCCGLPREPSDIAEPDDDCPTCTSCRGMPEWSVNPLNMNLTIKDTPMWWDAPHGPNIDMTLSYNSQDSLISVRPFGEKWTFKYSAYAMQDPSGSVLIVWGNAAFLRFSPSSTLGVYPVSFTAESEHAEYSLVQTGAFEFEVTNRSGTTFTFGVPPAMSSAASLLLSIEDRYDTSIDIVHNGQGAVTSVTHSVGGTWDLVYGANGKVASIFDPFDREATFTYTEVNGQQRLTGQTDMGGASYGYGYTTAAQVRERDPFNLSTFVTRTQELFVDSITLPTGVWQFYTEPADGIHNGTIRYPAPGGTMWENYRITITDPIGQLSEYYFDGVFVKGWYRDAKHYAEGAPPDNSSAPTTATTYDYSVVTSGQGKISETIPQGGSATINSNYHSTGQPQTVTHPDGRTTKYTYNSKGNVLTRQEGEDSDPDKIIYITHYEANGIDVASQSKMIGGVPWQDVGYIYDPVTRDVVTQLNFVFHNEMLVQHDTTYLYNAVGQLLETTDPCGGVIKNTYTVEGRLEKVEFKAPNQTVFKVQALYEYDDIGRLIVEQDAEGYILLHEYDDLNRRIKTTYPDETYTQKTHSCCTLTSSRARDGSITHYTYDALKRVTQVVGPGGQTTAYEYDANGNVTKLRFGRGEWVAWEYDEGNRVISKIYPDTSTLTYEYDETHGGRLESTTDASNRTTSYNYNDKGRIESITHSSLPYPSNVTP